VEIYRKFVNEHYRLIPYLQTNGQESMDSKGGFGTIRAIAKRPDDIYPFKEVQPTTYSYLLGNDIVVHPVHEDVSKDDVEKDGSNVVLMEFPLEDQQWVSWWAPSCKHMLVTVDTTVEGSNKMPKRVTLDSAAVYVRRGALLPLQRSASDESVIFTWFSPTLGSEQSTFVRESVSEGVGYEASVGLDTEGTLRGSISAHAGGAGWQISGVAKPSNVSFEGADVTSCSSSYDLESFTFSAYCSDASAGLKLHASSIQQAL